MPNPSGIICSALLGTTLMLATGCAAPGSTPSTSASSSIPVKPEVAHAITLEQAALDSLIAAGLSGDREAMLFSPLTEADYAARVREFNRSGRVTDEYLEFASDFQRSVDVWRSLLADGVLLAQQAAGDGHREEADRILTSLTNIAEANAGEGRPLVGRTIARDSLDRIAELRESIENR